jgi:hypothetical protein
MRRPKIQPIDVMGSSTEQGINLASLIAAFLWLFGLIVACGLIVWLAWALTNL